MKAVSDTSALDLQAWTHAALAGHGLAASAAPTMIHRRAWATVLQLPTTGGDVYLKLLPPGFRHETQVTAALSRWLPTSSAAVLAADAEHGRLLMADGGPTLRQAFAAGLPRTNWGTILRRYAALQIKLAPRAQSLLALSLPDHRLQSIFSLYDRILADKDALMLDHPDGLSVAEHTHLLALRPTVQADLTALSAAGVPLTIHHNDLHDANIFYRNGRIRFFDWGDASLSHPFFSLRTVFISIENSFGIPEDDPLFGELVAQYLHPWSCAYPDVDVNAALTLARRLWSVSSAIKYHTFLQKAGPAAADFVTAVPALLQELLAAYAGAPE